MERLLVASFKNDPEFDGFEPQVFDDPVNGKGMRVLRYRKNGKVDVYWQPGVRIDRSTFTVGAGIGDFAETTIEPAHFEITECGVDLHVAFTDEQGRKVELCVYEDAPGKHGFPLLAPVGADIKKPRQLFLVYMPSIDLDVTEQWKPSGLPLSMEIFTRVVSMFRTWPATYRWRGVVELGAAPTMSGAWERKGSK